MKYHQRRKEIKHVNVITPKFVPQPMKKFHTTTTFLTLHYTTIIRKFTICITHSVTNREVIMENELIKMAASQGLYATLFVALLLYVLKTNAEREKQYQSTINKLADKFDVVEDIQKDVSEIKESIKEVK